LTDIFVISYNIVTEGGLLERRPAAPGAVESPAFGLEQEKSWWSQDHG